MRGIAPNRQAAFETEFFEVLRPMEVESAAREFLTAEADHLAGSKADQFRHLPKHDGPAERGRKRGNEQPMITAGRHAGDRARRIAAESVGHEPFAVQERLGMGSLLRRPGHPADEFTAQRRVGKHAGC